MNLKKVKKAVAAVFKDWGLDFKPEDKDGYVNYTNSLTLKSYDDDIFAKFSYYESGLVSVTFTFDKLRMNEQTLRMVNQFNEETVWFKAYIDSEKGFLRLENTVPYMDETLVGKYTELMLNKLADDKLKPYLTPICALTE